MDICIQTHVAGRPPVTGHAAKARVGATSFPGSGADGKSYGDRLMDTDTCYGS